VKIFPLYPSEFVAEKIMGRLLFARCTCEIKSMIAMAKAAFNKKKTLFTSKLDLNLRNY
jgi:hypothetical protein